MSPQQKKKIVQHVHASDEQCNISQQQKLIDDLKQELVIIQRDKEKMFELEKLTQQFTLVLQIHLSGDMLHCIFFSLFLCVIINFCFKSPTNLLVSL